MSTPGESSFGGVTTTNDAPLENRLADLSVQQRVELSKRARGPISLRTRGQMLSVCGSRDPLPTSESLNPPPPVRPHEGETWALITNQAQILGVFSSKELAQDSFWSYVFDAEDAANDYNCPQKDYLLPHNCRRNFALEMQRGLEQTPEESLKQNPEARDQIDYYCLNVDREVDGGQTYAPPPIWTGFKWQTPRCIKLVRTTLEAHPRLPMLSRDGYPVNEVGEPI